MQEWEQRVKDEYDALQEKCVSLQRFIMESPVYDMLPRHQQILLQLQLETMQHYLTILELRLETAGSAV